MTMTSEMRWGYCETEDMRAIGQATCERISRLLCRASDNAAVAAQADRLIDDTLRAHPAVAAAIEARRAAAVTVLAAEPVAGGVARALRLED
jgi:serine/threonine protein kinase HipA of HipAB toxin-antitoxin module